MIIVSGCSNPISKSESSSDFVTEEPASIFEASSSDVTSKESSVLPQATKQYKSYSDVLTACRTYVNTLIDNPYDTHVFYNIFYIPYENKDTHVWDNLYEGFMGIGSTLDIPVIEYGFALKRDLGYTIKDLNGNGSPELILLTKDYTVVALFTMHYNGPLLIDGYWSRYFCTIDSAGKIYVHSSGGISWCDSTYRISEDDSKLLLIDEFGQDGMRIDDPSKPYNYKIANGEKRQIDDNEMEELISQFHSDNPGYEPEDHEITRNSGLEFVPLFKE